MAETSIFTKIITRELPATIRYEDDEFIAFDDIHPHAPVHVLVVPKKPYATLETVHMDDHDFYAHLIQVARKVAKLMKVEKNYKLVMNVGKQMQAVYHVHLHVLGGWDQPGPHAEKL